MKSLYCVNAEHGFCTRPSGTVVPCCISAENMTNDRMEPANLAKDHPLDLWKGTYLKKLRDDLNNGVYHPNCRQCWDEESHGMKSKRLRDNERWAELTELPTQDRPKLLDLSLGNTCNLACRTCNTVSSSRWFKEEMRTKIDPQRLARLRTFNSLIKQSYDENAAIWDFVQETIPDVVHIDFYGGEPMLVKRHWHLLDSIPDDKAANISVHFNTNGTQWDEDYAKTLTRFKAVNIDISIDGIEDVFEYMRWPANWAEVNANILKFKELSDSNPQIRLGICITLSILNIWNLPNTVDYAHSIGISSYLNMLHGPASMSLKNLPERAKELVLERLEVVQHDQIEGVKDFVRDNRFNSRLQIELMKTLFEHDRLRNQNFEQLMPELYKALKNV